MGILRVLRKRYARELSATQVAVKLMVTRRHVINLCKSGAFPGAYQDDDRNTNGQWWIPEEAVEAYKDRNK
jgi:hypothetical protein